MKKFLIVTEDKRVLRRRVFATLRDSSECVLAYPPWKGEMPDDVTDILVVSGDGGMLRALERYSWLKRPFCGLNVGHEGFLMNELAPQTVQQIAEGKTVSVFLRRLKAKVFLEHREPLNLFAYNEFWFERTTPQAAKIKVAVNDDVRFDPLVCDGILVCTQAGSTAYNASAGGVILPLETEAMVLTGICPAPYHRWRTSLLPRNSLVVLEPTDVEKRPVRFLFDGKEIANVVKAEISYDDSISELKFAESQPFREKVLNLQFARR